MSSSPFAEFANTTLRFPVDSGASVADPATGNVTPITTIVQVSAMLKQRTDKTQFEELPGVDRVSVRLEGYAVEPLNLPSVIAPYTKAGAVWDGHSGEFYLEPYGRSPYGVNELLGDKIRGWFRISDFVVDGDAYVPSTPDTRHLAGQRFTEAIVAAASLSGLRVVTLDSAGKLIYADCRNQNHTFLVLGLLPNAIAQAGSTKVLIEGLISDPAWNWLPGEPIFLGIDGALTQTAPTTGFLQPLGEAVSPQRISFEIQPASLYDE